eukprot:COSAG05_NODE_333_length_11249_cov_629.633094_5_plen_154_part_00
MEDGAALYDPQELVARDVLPHQAGVCGQSSATLHAGALASYPAWKDWLAWSLCVNGDCAGKSDPGGCSDKAKVGTIGHIGAEKVCAAKQNFNWTLIETCSRGDEGVELMRADANHDNSVSEVYGMQGLPVVHVGGEHVSVSARKSAPCRHLRS